MSSKKKANKTYRHGWASEGKAKKEKELEKDSWNPLKELFDQVDPGNNIKWVDSTPKELIKKYGDAHGYKGVGHHDIYSTCGPYTMGEIDKPCCASCPECRCHKENSEIPNNLSNVNCCEYCISLSIPKTCMIKKCGCHLPMGISNWINHGKQYHYFDYIDDKMLIELRQESRNYAKNGKSMQINPLKQRVYKRLVKMKLKDAASKINELVEEINKLKNENN